MITLPKVSLDIEELAWREDVSEYYIAAKIGYVIEERHGKSKDANRLAEYKPKIENEIAQAKAFKQEQDALADLTPDQLADRFLNLVPSVKPLISVSASLSAVEEQGVKTTQALPEAKPVEPLRRGGPLPTPDADKEKIVKEWMEVQGKETQEDFSRRKGVATSTLRAWIRDLRAKKKLPPS